MHRSDSKKLIIGMEDLSEGLRISLSGIVKVMKAQKNTDIDDSNDYYLKSEGTNEHQNHTA